MVPKHFLPENPDDLVNHCLKGYVYENPTLSLLEKQKVVFNNKYDSKKVTLISGGGSGHEPGWVGFVGSGMLTATAQGDIFASPNYKNIKAAEYVTHSDSGTIFLITNYTGDNLYFGMAAQDLVAKYGESKVRLLRVTDDVAVGRSAGKLVGRRTLAGCVYVMKILGAASEKGYSIDVLCDLGESVNANIASINAGLDHVHIPGHPTDSDYGKLKPNEIEVGLGIHNEPGVKKVDQIPSNEELVNHLLKLILDENDEERGFLKYDQSDTFALLFNNLAGLPIIEERALLCSVVQQLHDKYGIVPKRVYSGTFITSINAPIFTISLFNITRSTNEQFNENDIIELLDDPTDATSFPKRFHSGQEILDANKRIISNFEMDDEDISTFKNDLSVDPKFLVTILQKAANNIISKEPELTDWDTKMGDGDCGITVKTGAVAVLRALDKGVADKGSLMNVLQVILKILREDMGGTFGAILFIFMKAFIYKLSQNFEGLTRANQDFAFADALSYAIQILSQFTKAREGHRTVMDVLIPFCSTYSETKDIDKAVCRAKEAAEGTRRLRPKVGRAAYVGGISETSIFPPDPGAYAVYEIISALRNP